MKKKICCPVCKSNTLNEVGNSFYVSTVKIKNNRICIESNHGHDFIKYECAKCGEPLLDPNGYLVTDIEYFDFNTWKTDGQKKWEAEGTHSTKTEGSFVF